MRIALAILLVWFILVVVLITVMVKPVTKHVVPQPNIVINKTEEVTNVVVYVNNVDNSYWLNRHGIVKNSKHKK